MKKKNENLEKYLKKYRSTSSNLDERNCKISDLSNNTISKENQIQEINNKTDQKEIITQNYNKKTTNINYIKSHHHRKRSSSYMMGSYIPNKNIFECNYDKDDYNNQNTQENNLQNFDFSNNKSKASNNNDTINNEENNKLEKKNEIELKQTKNNENDKNIIPSPDSNNNVNISFPSYEENNSNNSVIIKQGENINNDYINNSNTLNKDNNNILENLKLQDPTIFNNSKSFIPFKNSLKYIKDQDERTTPSYQLALEIDKKNNNINYVAASNIIEEEKSSMMDSEFSNKNDHPIFNEIKINEEKKNFLMRKKIQNVNIDLSKLKKSQNGKINSFISNKCSYFKDKIKKMENDDNKKNNENLNNKMFLALNEIIIKNNRKEENRRKFLTKNKMELLNTFFTMTKPLNTCSNKNIFNSNLKPQIHIHTENSISNQNRIINDEVIKTNINFNKRISINPKSNILNKEFLYNSNLNTHENTENNLIKTSIPKKNSSKIPHFSSTKRKSNKNIINENNNTNNLIITPFKKIDPRNINNNFSSSLKEKRNSAKNINNLSKPQIIIKQNDEKNHSLKRIENLNNALSFIREKNILNKTNANSRNSASNNVNIYYYKKIQPLTSKNSHSNSKNNVHSSSSVNTHANSNTNNNISGKNNKSLTNNNNTNNCIQNYNYYNHKSLPRSKEKIKIRINYLRKANSGSFNNKGEYISNETIEYVGDNSARGICNKSEVIFCLKYKIVFNKLYEKIDVFEKIKIINNGARCFLIVLCEIKKISFAFCGLFKYYNEKESFRKIYGDERCPSYILLKDIKNGNKYNVYEDKNKYDTSVTTVKSFILMEKFRFCNNCVIICKNN